MNKVTISVTGHRLLSAQQKNKLKPVLERAIRNILFTLRERDPAVSFEALSPLAEGADTVFAQVALSIGLPFKVLLPFDKDQYLMRFSTEEARLEFSAIYNAVSEGNKETMGLDPLSSGDAFMELGRKLVNDADYLVAVWNEQHGHGVGGTADVVAYAQAQKKNILLINPEDEQPFINYLHSDYEHKRSVDVFDIAETNHLVSFINEKQRVYDDNAVKYHKKYIKVWTAGFITGLVEVFAFSLIVSFHGSLTVHFLLALVEFLCIVVIILLVIFGRSKELHSKYVHYRIVGERLRIKKFFSDLGFRLYHTTISPIYASFKEKPEYEILDNTIRLINLSAFSYLSFEDKKRRLDEELLTDQYKYHERKKEKFEKRNKLYKKIREGLFLVFVAAVVLHFVHVANEFLTHHGMSSWDPPLFHVALFEELILLCSIFIPATIAAAEALKYLYEWEKIITLSASMAAYFRERSKKLKDVHTDDELEVFLNDINKDMLIENLDWEKYMHDKNEVPT